jgi:hypothetical protein
MMYKIKLLSVIIMCFFFTRMINAAHVAVTKDTIRKESIISLTYERTDDVVVGICGKLRKLKGIIVFAKNLDDYEVMKSTTNQREIIVAVDKNNNLLKIFAKQEDLYLLRNLVKRLDAKRRN